MSAAVNRPLTLATPIEDGPDVKELQRAINRGFKHFKIDRSIAVDGEFGAQTGAAARQVALCLGITRKALKKLRRGTLSEGTQKLIRGERKLTRLERLARKRRGPYRSKLRKRFAKSAGQLAVAKGKKLVGIHEEPAGSNWGPQIGEWIKFTGYSGPVFWCGCYACWVVVKLGGAKIPNRLRLGYAPYITADALAHSNGLTAVPAKDARPGDLACLWGGQHIIVIAGRPSNGKVKTLEGNTTAPGKSGSQSNGGEVAQNERDLADFDAGIVARPSYR